MAGCRNLESVKLNRQVVLGNGAFKACESLEQVIVTGGDVSVSYLLAAVIRLMEDRFLFNLREAGTDEWYRNWDMRMMSVLGEPDEEGFSALIACGEEDYEGKDGNLESYASFRRKRKIRICMIRLMHDHLLDDSVRRTISDYLIEHRAGTDTPETWLVVRDEHGDDEEYYRLLCDLGCVGQDNIDAYLNDLGDSHPGMKAYLIRYVGAGGGAGFLDDMEF